MNYCANWLELNLTLLPGLPICWLVVFFWQESIKLRRRTRDIIIRNRTIAKRSERFKLRLIAFFRNGTNSMRACAEGVSFGWSRLNMAQIHQKQSQNTFLIARVYAKDGTTDCVEDISDTLVSVCSSPVIFLHCSIGFIHRSHMGLLFHNSSGFHPNTG